MKEIRVNPYLKFTLLLSQILILLLISNNQKLLALALIVTIVSLILRVPFKPIFRALTYGCFLSGFGLIFNYIFSQSWLYASAVATNIFLRFLIIVLGSLCYKHYTSNKEMAFVISKLAAKFGCKQNQVYTVVLVILNQIYNLRNLIFDLYRYNRINSEDLSRKQKIINIIKLLPVFINNALRQNDNFTLALLNKNYRADNQINVYLNYNISIPITIGLLILYCSEFLIILI